MNHKKLIITLAVLLVIGGAIFTTGLLLGGATSFTVSSDGIVFSNSLFTDTKPEI